MPVAYYFRQQRHDYKSIIPMHPQLSHHPLINGLSLHPEILTKQQQKILVNHILAQPWNTALKRRTQHYGYEYSYDRKSLATETTPIPQWCHQIKAKIQQLINLTYKDIQVVFDQLIVNQYEPGQGISPHIDNVKLFEGVVVSVSLGSQVVMVFERGEDKEEVPLKRRSAVVLTGEARYAWKHSIPSRKSDHGLQRGTRYSLTFREMLKQGN